MEERLFQHLFLTTSLWMSPISAILRNSVQIWISLTRQATTMPEEKKSKSKDDFSYKSRQRSTEVKEYKSQHRNNKMLFNKCNPTIPSVVLPRPAWQEKAHCVAAGSFFIFIIYELVYFLSLGSWSRYGVSKIMASFPSVDHFRFAKFRLILFFVTHFPPCPRNWPVSKSRQECQSRLRLDKSPPLLELSHTEVGQYHRMQTLEIYRLKRTDIGYIAYIIGPSLLNSGVMFSILVTFKSRAAVNSDKLFTLPAGTCRVELSSLST